MNPTAIIETYVSDVVRRLPRAKRADVAFELRSLLLEELEGRAADAGRPADAAMATDLLRTFGLPVDVADRYRPAGFTIIRPADAPRFAQIALIGVGVQWALSLVATYSVPIDASAPGGDWLSRLGGWWLTWGLGSFWWPGFIVTFSLIAAWIASRRSASYEPREPKVAELDRDRINRTGMLLTIGLGVVGAAIVIALPELGQWARWLPEPAITALALDGGFVAGRAPWVVLLWAATFASSVVVLVAGRWTRTTRLISAAFDGLWIALLLWWILGGPIFVSPYADSVTKFCLAALVIVCALDIVLTVRRTTRAIPVPAT
jgi:hypothetical protein